MPPASCRRDRDKVLRRRGLMPGGLRPLLRALRKQRLDLPRRRGAGEPHNPNAQVGGPTATSPDVTP